MNETPEIPEPVITPEILITPELVTNPEPVITTELPTVPTEPTIVSVMPTPAASIQVPPTPPQSGFPPPPNDANFGQSGTFVPPFVPPYVPPYVPPTGPATGQPSGQTAGQFRFMRSRSDKRAAGICGGIARDLNVETWIVRLVTVIIMFMTGIGFIVYIVAGVLIPQEPEGTIPLARNPQAKFGSWDSKQLVGASLLGLGGLMFMDRLNIGLNTDLSIPLLLIGGGAFALWNRREKLRKDQ